MNAKRRIVLVCLLLVAGAGAAGVYWSLDTRSAEKKDPVRYQPRRQSLDTSGFTLVGYVIDPWKDPTSLEQIQQSFARLGYRAVDKIDAGLSLGGPGEKDVLDRLAKAAFLLYEGEAIQAYETLAEARRRVEASGTLRGRLLYSVIYFQGVAALRRGENENCIECRGEGSCIFPLRPEAVHAKPVGSRLAIHHFTEYLEQFPDDQVVRWLLNLCYMTLGEHPDGVAREYLFNFSDFGRDADIGRFRDIAHRVGLNRFNMAGGAIMDDFDNDGLLDIVVSTWDSGMPMAYFRNQGDGTFLDCTEAAGLSKQVGTFNLVQTDYNNDGFLDIYVMRGGWLPQPMRPTLLRNNGNGTFSDVTRAAGLMDPVNSLAAQWADYDNDGFLDLFICCDHGPNRLYRNKGDGTFEEVAAKAGVQGKIKVLKPEANDVKEVSALCKGAAWLDFDNDGWPDLFLNYLESTPQLFRNNRDGTFSDVTEALGIDGPFAGFGCWAFDYDNDGWLDILATSYERTPADLIHSLRGLPIKKGMDVTRLWRNRGGKKFEDVSKEAGVNKVFAAMGCNFADFDNDGYLDFYLGTGDPNLETLIPNRMFKNMGGLRFADITTTAGTGHLQKGHGVACGDWDRDGNVDIFIEVGGAIPGDRFHNALFQNPGQGNNWLTLKLVGNKTNRAAIGARIKAVTAGKDPLTVHRHISSGSSWGGNPLQQTIGLGQAASVATLEIYWPTSKTRQIFRDVAVNQAIEVTESAVDYRKLNWTRIPIPK